MKIDMKHANDGGGENDFVKDFAYFNKSQRSPGTAISRMFLRVLTKILTCPKYVGRGTPTGNT